MHGKIGRVCATLDSAVRPVSIECLEFKIKLSWRSSRCFSAETVRSDAVIFT